LVNHSADAIEFIADFGLELSNLIQLGGHSAKRYDVMGFIQGS
jgi:hypothetical protein